MGALVDSSKRDKGGSRVTQEKTKTRLWGSMVTEEREMRNMKRLIENREVPWSSGGPSSRTDLSVSFPLSRKEIP